VDALKNTVQFLHLAFEALLAIFEQCECHRAVVDPDARGCKDSCGGCSEQATD
jgi:hypothetical protein